MGKLESSPQPRIRERLPKFDAPTLEALDAYRRARAKYRRIKEDYDRAVASGILRPGLTGPVVRGHAAMVAAREDLDAALDEGV